jgi:hypothetical protein
VLQSLAADHARCVEMGRRGRALLETRYARAKAHAAWARLLAAVAAE